MPAKRTPKPINEVFEVEGGIPLRGEIEVKGNKNAALPIIAATLLTDQPVILRNVPDIRDVATMIKLVKSAGVSAKQYDDGSWRFHARRISTTDLDTAIVRRMRASILLAGPLLAREGKVSMWHPGGCVIGRRRTDTHILAFRKLGVDVSFQNGYVMQTTGMAGCDIWLDEASVTATENVLMLAVLAKGTTRLYNAACEPHVQDLCVFLNKMGANITGIGGNLLIIEGVERLHGADHTIISDHQEVGSFIAATVITGGETLIKNAIPEHLPNILYFFETLGVHCEPRGNDLFVPAGQTLETLSDISGAMAQISAQPWPGFPTDLLSVLIVLATQCKGAVMLHDKMFEARMFFTDRINSMGANISICDPHRVIVMGPTPLNATTHTSPDIRAGVSMLIATLGARGKSRLEHVEIIDRGYERIDERLRALGAHIERHNGQLC